MKAFELTAGTRLKLVKTTPRKEIHGDEHVQAISLRLRWETTNESLAKLHPNLKDMLFYRSAPTEAQEQLPELPEITPNLRVPTVTLPLKIDISFTGYTLEIEHGIDDSSALELYDCGMDKFAVDAKEGGTAIIEWSLSSNSNVTPELVGALCGLEGEEITIAALTAPEVKADPIDGTVGHPGLAAQRAAEAAGQQRLDVDDDLLEQGADDATRAFLAINGSDDDQDEDTDSSGPALAEEQPKRGRRSAAAANLE